MNFISLFTGAGGFDLGLEAAGWRSAIGVEIDADARSTALKNRPHWRFSDAVDADIVARNPQQLLEESGLTAGEVDLIVGGPPCQPFSSAGLWHKGAVDGLSDPRAQTLRSMMDIVDHILPRFVVIENVPGFKGNTDSRALSFLEKRFSRMNAKHGTRYRAFGEVVDAADYGAPQHRRRLFLVADRDGAAFSFPKPTHGSERRPHLTAWSAIGGVDHSQDELRGLRLTGKWADLLPSIPEGENYLWHTHRGGGEPLFGWRTRYWTFLLKLAKQRPSWTIHAQPGPSTGPFHWDNRQLSVRELARLQSFPDSYEFPRNYRTSRLLIGNAVPPVLGEAIGRKLVMTLGETPERSKRWFKTCNSPCPRRKAVRSVPSKYIRLAGNHASHPGVGLGPGARKKTKEDVPAA